MSDQNQVNQTVTPPADVPTIEIPHVEIPHVDIPHMGTVTPSVTAQTPQPQPQPQAQTTTAISQDSIDAAIAQVEKTGSTEGIPPDVLGAACAQIEAQAAAQGIDLNAAAQAQDQAGPPPSAPAHAVDAAVVDKQSAFEAFGQQRDTLKDAVSGQREALKKPYLDAMNKAAGNGPEDNHGADSDAMKALATAIEDLDPKTMALINAMSMVSNNPGVLNSVVWLEIIQAIRQLISSEAKIQVEAFMKSRTA